MFSGAPKIDQQNDKKRSQNEPWNHDNLEPQATNCRNVIVDVPIAIKESVTIAKDVSATN